MFQIYTLHDQHGELRYVGQTHNTLARRLMGHLTPSSLKPHNHKNSWINSLLALGIKPEIQLLQVLNNQKELDSAETYWISFFRNQGCRLVNNADGGNGPRGCTSWIKGKHHTEEAKKKMSLAKLGRKWTIEQCQNIGNGHRGKHYHTSESIAKIKEANTGRPMSEEACILMSVAAKKRLQDPKERARLLALNDDKKIKIKDQNGVVYNSCKEAARILNLSPSSVERVVRGLRPSIKGFIFTRILET